MLPPELLAKLRGVSTHGDEELRAVCPYCGNKRSFKLNEYTGLWYCHSCEERGSLRRLMGWLRVPGHAAVLSQWKPSAPPPEREARHLPDYVLGAFDGVPQEMLDLGFSREVLEAHDIGFDRYGKRITFPIFSRDELTGERRLMAFSGRAVKDGARPRYYVYGDEFLSVVPGYRPWNRRYLYGLHTLTGDESCIIIVEGYKSCLWLRQLGFPGAVAVQGTYLTKQQLVQLQRFSGPFYIFLDYEPGKQIEDDRGRCAAERNLQRIGRAMDTWILNYPASSPINTAPDDLTKQQIKEMIHGVN